LLACISPVVQAIEALRARIEAVRGDISRLLMSRRGKPLIKRGASWQSSRKQLL